MIVRFFSTVSLVAALAACERSPSPQADQPAPPRSSSMSVDAGKIRLHVRPIQEPHWSGRLVIVSLDSSPRVRILPGERPQPLHTLVEGRVRRPYAAINGGFYDSNGTAMGLVRADGRDMRPWTTTGGSGIFFMEGSRPRIVHRDAYAATDTIAFAVQSIDRLVDEGRSLVRETSTARRAARSALAIDRQKRLHFVVAFDERAIDRDEGGQIALNTQSGSTGPTLSEMAELLLRRPADGGIGAWTALGLDGGYSTSIEFKDADDHVFRVAAYRATINAIVAE